MTFSLQDDSFCESGSNLLEHELPCRFDPITGYQALDSKPDCNGMLPVPA